MADKKYTTSLVVEADDSQVARLRDTLQQVSAVMQQISSQGRVGAGWGGGGGAGPGGGGQGGGGGGGGGYGPGGGGGYGPGGGGGGGPGGNAPPGNQPPGNGPPRQQIGVGMAHVVAQQDEGVLSAAAAAAPSVLPFLGAALGVAAGGLVGAALSRGRLGLEFDRQRAATFGLLRGFAPGIGSGAGLGFAPGETQSIAQAMARGSGLEGEDLLGHTGAGMPSLLASGLSAERAGYGASAVASFLRMFRPGGGGELSFGAGMPQINDATRMQTALNIAISGATRAGMSNVDIEKYLGRIAAATTAMADKGVQVDPIRLVATAEQMAARAGRPLGSGGMVDMSFAANMLGVAQQVSQGGGSPSQQYFTLMAAGFGQPGVSYYDAMVNAQRGRVDWNRPLDFMQRGAAGDPARARAFSLMYAREFGSGFEDMTARIMGDPGGPVNLRRMSTEGAAAQRRLGAAGVTDLMREDAAISTADVETGLQMSPVNLRARKLMHNLTNMSVGHLSRWMSRLIDMVSPSGNPRSGTDVGHLPPVEQAVPALRGWTQAKEMEELDLRAGPGGFDTGHGERSLPPRLLWPTMPRPATPHPATQIPDPKKGGGYIEIRPAPGMERFFAFHFYPDASGSGVPT